MVRVVRFGDVFIAVAVIVVVIMMIIPLPTILLDLLLAFNITFALIVLLLCMYLKDALDISVFPSLLLITTLFRLALNVSSTRLILLNGYAGEVIMSFGNFVVGGNAVVGFIVFVILIIIQFLVITRGAERVAEVAARFTLDAMPGKQMSIDADLNAGLIGESEARERREKIQREADFYGAMDGASKFVKGDAIAAILIVIINIVGGFILGIAMRGLDIMTALQT
ncbi:MAG: flagellar biosynthesis protein FlhA, partial [Negativicutes bacterium]|nr:flagellar biosynthesis protein FlhA [Negativicutes bacterium]